MTEIFGCTPGLLLTQGLSLSEGSSVDPSCRWAGWLAWILREADPSALESSDDVSALRCWFEEVLEASHDPGRTAAICEIAVRPDNGVPTLEVCLAVGAFGGSEASVEQDVCALRGILESSAACLGPAFPYRFEQVDPVSLLGGLSMKDHIAVVTQRTLDVPEGTASVRIPSTVHPTFDPLGRVASRLLVAGVPAAVRVTMLATEASLLEIDQVERARTAIFDRIDSYSPLADPEPRSSLESLDELRRSMRGPLFVAEVTCRSECPVPTAFLRSLATSLGPAFHAEAMHGQGWMGSGGLLEGTPGISAAGADVAAALSLGLPSRGGLGARRIEDLVSLGRHPLVIPSPLARCLASLPQSTSGRMAVPRALKVGEVLAPSLDGDPVCVPHALSNRHRLLLGDSGSGKSRLMAFEIERCAQSGSPFILLDPHGSLVRHVESVSPASSLVVLDGRSGLRISPFPALAEDVSNIAQVKRSVGAFADAVSSTMDDPAWAGPRWRQYATAIGMVMASGRFDLSTALEIFADRVARSDLLDSGLHLGQARQTLRLLDEMRPDEAAGIVDWTISKFEPIVNGGSSDLLAEPGSGIEMEVLLDSGRSMLCDLSLLTRSELSLVGTILLSRVFEAARATTRQGRHRVIVDEAPLVHASQLAVALAEARKFGLDLTLSAQSLSQFKDPHVRDMLASSGVKVAFRHGPASADVAALLVEAAPGEIRSLPDLQAIAKVGTHPPVGISLPPYPTSASGATALGAGLSAEEREAEGPRGWVGLPRATSQS